MCKLLRLTLILVCSASCPVLAEFKPTSHARAAAPFIDDQMIAVLRIDMTRVDIDALRRKVIEIGQLKSEDKLYHQIDEARQTIQKWLFDFTYAGGKDIYIIFSLADLPKFFLVVPPKPQADIPALIKLLESSISGEFYIEDIEQIKGAIAAGSSETIQRLKNMTTAPSPALADAFAVAGDTTAQLLIILNQDQQRVLSEMAPPLPRQLGSLPTTALARALRWVALGIDGPPGMKLNITIQTPDPASAYAFRMNLNNIYQALRQLESLQECLPHLNDMLTLLTPAVKENRVILQLNHEQINSILTTLTDLLTPLIIKSREKAKQAACMHNLKVIAAAIVTFRNDFGDKNPPTLQALIETEDLAPQALVCPGSSNKIGQVSYVYRGGDLVHKPNISPFMIIAYDKLENHKGMFRNVLFTSMDVSKLTEEEFQKAIARDNGRRRELNLLEIPAP